MKKVKAILFSSTTFCVFVSILAISIAFSQEPITESVIELSYLPVENSSEKETFTMTAKLKAKNISSEPIYNAKATVYSVENMAIDITELFLGDIGAEKTVVSPEKFTVSFDNSMQETPQNKIVWLIEYTNENGENFFEQILFQ